MPFTNAAEADILDALFTVLGDEGSLWAGLSTTTPAQDGTGVTEPTTGGYARVEIDTDDFAAASGADPSTKANDAAIDFGTASGTWSSGSNMTHLVIFDASTSGTPVFYAALSTPKPVMDGDPVSIAIGDLVFQLGAP